MSVLKQKFNFYGKYGDKNIPGTHCIPGTRISLITR